ncbi:MAG: hypothetical protein FJ108_12000 [Deltaproteobacteria bacterium]|nr:hypothetical protein [Deltaproteobacteria bacterium]
MVHRLPEPQLAELVRAASRLLRVESGGPRELWLRFDRGLLSVSLEDGGLALALGGGAPLSPEAEVLDETDPWWTVLGAPVQGAWSLLDADRRRLALELQLRRDDENPKIVVLEPQGARIRTRALPKSAWVGAK